MLRVIFPPLAFVALLLLVPVFFWYVNQAVVTENTTDSVPAVGSVTPLLTPLDLPVSRQVPLDPETGMTAYSAAVPSGYWHPLCAVPDPRKNVCD